METNNDHQATFDQRELGLEKTTVASSEITRYIDPKLFYTMLNSHSHIDPKLFHTMLNSHNHIDPKLFHTMLNSHNHIDPKLFYTMLKRESTQPLLIR